jgi:hypothetical protein
MVIDASKLFPALLLIIIHIYDSVSENPDFLFVKSEIRDQIILS